MTHHAHLEQAFKHNLVGPDGKMIVLDDELNQDIEENKQVISNLRKTTSNLVRQFASQQMQLKLKGMGDSRSNEYAGLIDVFEQMKLLWHTKLTTPLEEQESIKAQLRLLEENTKKLTETRNTKSENLKNYEDQTKEAKEAREYEITTLKKTIADENAAKEDMLKKLEEEKNAREERLKQDHLARKTMLLQTIKDLEEKHKNIKEQNKKDEDTLRANYDKADRGYHESLKTYDDEMKQNTQEKDEAQQTHDQELDALKGVNEEFKQIQEERRKREEILEMMKKKEAEQQR